MPGARRARCGESASDRPVRHGGRHARQGWDRARACMSASRRAGARDGGEAGQAHAEARRSGRRADRRPRALRQAHLVPVVAAVGGKYFRGPGLDVLLGRRGAAAERHARRDGDTADGAGGRWARA
eukprot:2323350-Prymnesium_polylepis.1